MNPTPNLPEAKVGRRRRFPISVVWLVPILAALIAGWLVYKSIRTNGPVIWIRFTDGRGLQAAQTMIRYRGVRVGEVETIRLTPDARWVEVEARLDTSAAHLARAGTQFWVVRPSINAGSLRGLETIVGGPYIQIQPGAGPPQRNFVGLEEGPVAIAEDDGLDVKLTWPRLGWLNRGAPVYYRGVQVGTVQDYRLGNFATNIVIQAHIRRKYADLVRTDSEFWNAGGIVADFGLFNGLSVRAESLKSLLMGGIAFATPSPPGPPVAAGKVFLLHEKPQDDWLKWAPPIPINSETNYQ